MLCRMPHRGKLLHLHLWEYDLSVLADKLQLPLAVGLVDAKLALGQRHSQALFLGIGEFEIDLNFGLGCSDFPTTNTGFSTVNTF